MDPYDYEESYHVNDINISNCGSGCGNSKKYKAIYNQKHIRNMQTQQQNSKHKTKQNENIK